MGLGLSPDGTRLAACDAVGAVRLTDLRTGKTAACRAASGRRAAALAFAPDGALFATGDVDGRVRFWDGATGGLVREVKEPSAVHALEFRPSDGMLAIACGDGSVTILDPATGAALSRRPCGERAVECLAFGPGADGGPILVTGSWDYAVRLRDGDGRVERAALTGHSEVVFSAAFGPDGRTLATGSGSRYFDVPGEVRLWDAATGRLHAEFKGRSGPVAFAPDGRFLVTCDPAGPIRLWPGR
jgi:WD40 repeat protein